MVSCILVTHKVQFLILVKHKVIESGLCLVAKKYIVSFSPSSEMYERLFRQTQLSVAYPFLDEIQRKCFMFQKTILCSLSTFKFTTRILKQFSLNFCRKREGFLRRTTLIIP